MAEWRDRGYVPDSDEEDEDSLESVSKDDHASASNNQIHWDERRALQKTAQLELQPLTNELDGIPVIDIHSSRLKGKETFDHVAISVQTTAQRLGAEIQRGLDACRDVLRDPLIPSLSDDDDSPLSSLSSSPLGSPTKPTDVSRRSPKSSSNVQLNSKPETVAPSNVPSAEPQDQPSDPAFAFDDIGAARPSRSLRPRTLLQINPYSLEYARYQQDCNRRGLVPVRLANFAAERAKINGQETQGSKALQSSERGHTVPRGSSPLSFTESEGEVSQSPVRGSRQVIDDAGSSDDLPDLADILQGHAQVLPRPQKSRSRKDTTVSGQIKRKKPVFKRYDLPTEMADGDEDVPSRKSSVFDFLPSPPHSSSASSNHMLGIADNDELLETTPRLLPTPVLSSDRQSTKRRVIEVSSSSEEEMPAEAEPLRSPGSNSPNEDSQGLMQIRRRIKGVLPASWLRIDANHQKKKTTERPKQLSPQKTIPNRGVAKHVQGSGIQGSPVKKASRPLIFSSDLDEGSSSDAEGTHRDPARPAPDLAFSDSDVAMDEIIVEDEVDTMAPTTSRPYQPRKTAKHQQRLNRVWDQNQTVRFARRRSSQSVDRALIRRKSNKVGRKRSKQSHRSAQLSVLDAPGFAAASRGSHPRFLKLAARKPVNARPARPQDPAKKYFHLATREDTVEVNTDLREWRLGHWNRPRPEPDRSARSHLNQLHHAQPQSVLLSDNHLSSQALDQLKLTTVATLSRLRTDSRTAHRSAAPTSDPPPTLAGQQRFVEVFNKRAHRSAYENKAVCSHTPPLSCLALATRRASGQASSTAAVLAPRIPQPPMHREDNRGPTLQEPAPLSEAVTRSKGKQKNRPRRIAVSHIQPDEHIPSALLLDVPDYGQGGPSVEDTDQDIALALWAAEQLAAADGLMPTFDTEPLQMSSSHEMIRNVFEEHFSWKALRKTYLEARSIRGESTIIDAHSERPGLRGALSVLLSDMGRDERALGSSKKPNNELENCINSSYETPSSRLAATLLILHILTTLCWNDSEGAIPSTSKYDGWSVLQPAIGAFLNHHLTTKSRAGVVYQDLGIAAIRFCYWAVRHWRWPSADGITKFWFKQYAENSMIELFIVPDLEQLELRSQRLVTPLALRLGDTDFDMFLKMTAALLQDRGKSIGLSGNTGRAASRIQSLVFGMSPNNSRELSDDQNLLVEDLVSMANIYALYEYLNEFAPSGCQPRFSLIEKLVNFPKCHWSVCHFALRAWSRYTSIAIDHGDHSKMYNLGSWLKKTIMQMVDKYAFIYTEAAGLRLSGAHFAITENAETTHTHVLELLQAWKDELLRCPTAMQGRALLGGGDISEVIMLCNGNQVDDDRVVVSICEIVQAYLSKCKAEATDDFRNALHKQLKDVVSFVLSSEEAISSERLRSLTSLWFAFAEIAVVNKRKSWDDFLTLPSSWSFSMLADSELSRQSKLLFLSKIINHDSMQLELDRELFYDAWITGLVRPEHNLRFEHELTKSMILHDTEALSLTRLRTCLQDSGGHFDLSLSEFKLHRLDVVKHIIRNIYSLQFDDEDSQDFLDGPLSVHQGRNLLKVMISAMKASWQALATHERQPYTDFVQAVLVQLRIYTYKDFVIDPWFVDPQQPEFPKETPFAEQFLIPIGTPKPAVDERLVRVFTSANLQAAGTIHEQAWVKDIVRALSANDITMMDAEGSLAINAEVQNEFIRKVLCVFVKVVFKDPRHTFFGRPVLAALVEVIRDWHFRLDAGTEEAMQQMLAVAVELLSAVLTALESQDVVQLIAHGAAGKVVGQTLELGMMCTRRMVMLEPLLEHDGENVRLVEEGYKHALAIHELMSGGTPMRGYATNDEHDEQDFHVRQKVLEILEEGLQPGTRYGERYVPAWQSDNPMASSWEAWLGTEDEMAAAVQKHHLVLKKFEKVLVDAELLDQGSHDSEEALL